MNELKSRKMNEQRKKFIKTDSNFKTKTSVKIIKNERKSKIYSMRKKRYKYPRA